MRHRILHAQVLAPDLLEKLTEIKPYLEIQSGFMMSEYNDTAKWVLGRTSKLLQYMEYG
ncbi:hypothetical protein SAMN05192559_11454 [Halobacillus karajensis]|uniref:hypothetical protein n=1 Tax=Halobacillus karajensis TaxID=195088 RepID=UPI0008A7CA88|nr:hypothetical protein [Halobacillus karajensis]SEI12130.1 hypothetical protein SAMN05192559_11454 [Halobacillus karajensis]